MWPLVPGKHVKGFMYSRVRTEKLWTLIPQVKHDVLGEAVCCLLLPLSLLRLTLAGRSLRLMVNPTLSHRKLTLLTCGQDG